MNDEGIKEVSKQEYEELFKWLFGPNVKIKQEEDIKLAVYYDDMNIYYTEEIYNLFQTKPMKRLGEILQLGSKIYKNSNYYHTRLEHSKGAYMCIIEFLAVQFRKNEWKEYIEKNKLKGYLVEKIKFMCVHDIGHAMFSHSIEKEIGDGTYTHEDIGEKIVKENEEIREALERIKANEEESNLEGDGSLESLCDGNIDFDRMDFLVRDRLYVGEAYMGNLMLRLNTMCDLKFVEQEGKYRYVYKPEAIESILKFLMVRVHMYKTQYISKEGIIEDQLASNLVEAIKNREIQKTEKLQAILDDVMGKSIQELNVDTFLQMNDILFFNELIKAIDELEKNDALYYTMLSNKALLQVAISMLEPTKIQYETYTEEEKQFIKNLRGLISSGKNIKGKSLQDIATSVELKEDKRQEIIEKINTIIGINRKTKGIYAYKAKFRLYDEKSPIYVQDENSEIYTLDKYPNLQTDLSTKYTYGVYAILPELRQQGIDEIKILKIKDVIEQYQRQYETLQEKKDRLDYNRMSIFEPSNPSINYAKKINQFFRRYGSENQDKIIKERGITYVICGGNRWSSRKWKRNCCRISE